jgi:hypothetical protein
LLGVISTGGTIGCGNVGAAATLLNPKGAGSIVKTFPGLGGTDELWYDSINAFYVTGELLLDGGQLAREPGKRVNTRPRRESYSAHSNFMDARQVRPTSTRWIFSWRPDSAEAPVCDAEILLRKSDPPHMPLVPYTSTLRHLAELRSGFVFYVSP